MGKVELRRGRNKIVFRRNVLEAWQNLEDTFFHCLFFNILLILPPSGFQQVLTWLGLQVPRKEAPRGPKSGELVPMGAMVPLRPWEYLPGVVKFTPSGEGQGGTEALLKGWSLGHLCFPLR